MKLRFLTFLGLLLTLFYTTAFTQKPRSKLKNAGVVELNDSLTTYSQSDIFDFPNVNVIPYYHNEAALSKLAQLSGSGNDEARYRTLRAYVRNFGIENFWKDTKMIWGLAKLSEKYGPPGEAILLYKLVLKHHRQDIDEGEVRQEYDTISKDQTDNYVPLDYYYKLVEYRKEIDTLQPPHGVLLNMGPLINSDKPDYAPTIGNRDDMILFTSKRNQHTGTLDPAYDEDLFYGIKSQGLWQDVSEFKTINTQYNEGSACLSEDGKFLYFARCNCPDSEGNCDLYVAELQPDSTWGNVHNLGPNINSPSWDSHPSLSHSGDTLFFSSDRLGGFGLADIYYAVKDKKGEWQKALNIGPIINTRRNEVSPFFHHKFNVLYFSSDGQPLNFGNFDIYKSYRIGKNWDEPKNVGPLVNGAGSEYYFTIDSRSQNLFYARSEPEDVKNLDLYSFPVPMEAQPEAVTALKGTLKNSQTGKPLKGIVSIIDLDHGVEVAPKFIRADGSFDFTLINLRKYLIIIQGDDFFRIEQLFYLNGDTTLDEQGEPVEANIKFQSVEFQPNKADILPEMRQDLNKVANFLVDHPSFKLTISGHTDSQGNKDANLKLSQDRADAIRRYLVEDMHIDGDRVKAIGYGSSQPLVEEHTEADRRLNRRVEFQIIRN